MKTILKVSMFHLFYIKVTNLLRVFVLLFSFVLWSGWLQLLLKPLMFYSDYKYTYKEFFFVVVWVSSSFVGFYHRILWRYTVLLKSSTFMIFNPFMQFSVNIFVQQYRFWTAKLNYVCNFELSCRCLKFCYFYCVQVGVKLLKIDSALITRWLVMLAHNYDQNNHLGI